jgi:4,5-dihydroxyphthalate decarboxylase
MSALKLSLAMCDYDHTRALSDGRVGVPGVKLNAQLFEYPSHIFHRNLTFGEWDIAEMSFAKYCWLVSTGDPRFVAIPVFPSRRFRHSAVFVRRSSSLSELSELRNRRVGVPEWAQTAGVYVRGMLERDYGVSLDEIEWFQGGVNRLGRTETAEVELPPGVTVTPIEGRTLSELLAEGQLDAVIAASGPSATPTCSFRTLLADPASQEKAYWANTGIFPIMHLVVLRREHAERHPWLPRNLRIAFEEAKNLAASRLSTTHVSLYPVAFLDEAVTRAKAALGGDLWPYGVRHNRKTIETFLDFACRQGVTRRRLDVAELFCPSSLDEFEN